VFSRYRKERCFQLRSISNLEAVRTGCITPVSSSLREKQNAIKGARYSYVTINKPITEYQTNLIYSLSSINWAGFQLSQR